MPLFIWGFMVRRCPACPSVWLFRKLVAFGPTSTRRFDQITVLKHPMHTFVVRKCADVAENHMMHSKRTFKQNLTPRISITSSPLTKKPLAHRCPSQSPCRSACQKILAEFLPTPRTEYKETGAGLWKGTYKGGIRDKWRDANALRPNYQGAKSLPQNIDKYRLSRYRGSRTGSHVQKIQIQAQFFPGKGRQPA